MKTLNNISILLLSVLSMLAVSCQKVEVENGDIPENSGRFSLQSLGIDDEIQVVGTKAFGMDANTFWTKLCNERFVELAFEGHRFWDVRRWKEADKYFRNIVEMKLIKEADGNITYMRKNVSRQWDDKMYLFPIPQSERSKNPNLTQNPGWE